MDQSRTDMLTQSASPSLITSSQAASCKFLFSREQLVFCHIHLPGELEKVPAIVHEKRYYSLFKTVGSGESALDLVNKLGSKGNSLAITQAGQRYIIWVEEPDAEFLPSHEERVRDAQFTFPSATCLLLPNSQSYQFSYVAVPGLNRCTPAFQYEQRLYSLLHREVEVDRAIAAIAELGCRGIELALIALPQNYVICTLEHNASLSAA